MLARTAVASRFSALCATMLMAGAAHAQVKFVTWNVTNYGGGRFAEFQTAIYGVVPTGLPLAGQSMNPDVFVGQEFLSQSAVNDFLTLLNTAPGSPADWAAAPFLDGADTDSAFFYRTSKIQYLGTTTIAVGSSSTANQPRDTRRYDIRPIGYTAASASLGIYSVHLKAQGGTNSSGRRLIEAQRIRDNAEGQDTNGPGTALPAGFQFLVAGDYNGQTSSESFYVEWVGSQANNAGRFFDPISTPGNWNNNPAFRFIHTQDPAVQVDDRHDQILVGGGLVDGDGLDYIGAFGTPWNLATFFDPNHTYMCWGNDGSSFDQVLNTANNQMVGNAIANALVVSANGLGHLPIKLDLRVPAEVTSPILVDFGQVTQGSTAQQSVSVGNAGDTALFGATGIDSLVYTLSTGAGFTAPAGAFVDAAGGTLNSHSISMDTSTVGPKAASLTIASNAPDEPARVVMLIGEVVATPPNCPGDVNGDNAVNTQDLTILLQNFGTSVPTGTLGDLNDDGVVNTLDLTALLEHFGTFC